MHRTMSNGYRNNRSETTTTKKNRHSMILCLESIGMAMVFLVILIDRRLTALMYRDTFTSFNLRRSNDKSSSAKSQKHYELIRFVDDDAITASYIQVAKIFILLSQNTHLTHEQFFTRS